MKVHSFVVLCIAFVYLALFQVASAGEGSVPATSVFGPFTVIPAPDSAHLPLITHIKILGETYPVVFTKKGELIKLGDRWIRFDGLYVYGDYLRPYLPFFDSAESEAETSIATVTDKWDGKLIAKFVIFKFSDGRKFALEQGNEAILEMFQAYFIEEITRREISDPSDPQVVLVFEDVLAKINAEIKPTVARND